MPNLDILKRPGALDIYHRGPSLDLGPLPSIFYFSLSGNDSLTLDPFNQPVEFLQDTTIRCFSMTMPGHGGDFQNHLAMDYWAQQIGSGNDVIHSFVNQVLETIEYLIQKNYIDPEHLAVSGLSRGVFVAAHIAARDTRIRTLLGFAPLIILESLSAFQSIRNDPLVQQLSLFTLIDKLASKTIRCYIGNLDVLVGTEHCFEFIKKLADTAYSHKLRSPPMELVIYPSIGHKGHGTPPNIFRDGIDWLKKAF